MEHLVHKLRKDYATFIFVQGQRASWSPNRGEITYTVDDETTDSWSLLHELGHAIAGHSSYKTDVELLQREIQAWEQALSIAPTYAIQIDQNHIEDCLDSYRDWLHKRSSCPTCGSHGLQHSENLYGCFNCQTTWKVTSARFCRPYRLKKTQSA